MKDGKIIYLSGKVLVNDYSKDNKTPAELKEYDYQDNIIEILEQENIVEELENRKKELNNNIYDNEESIKENISSQKTLFGLWIGLPLFMALLGFVISPNVSAGTLFGIKQLWLSMGIVGGLAATFVNGFAFLALKQSLKLIKSWKKGSELELEELEKQLEKNNEILNQLRNDKTKENEEQAMAKKTDNINNIHLEKYRKIRRLLMAYREIGENEKELLEYYNNNVLDEKLQNSYDPEEIEEIKTYFKTKK